MLKRLDLPVSEKKLLKAMLATFEHIVKKIHESSTLIEELYERLPEAKRIRTVPGFGKFLSVMVAVEIAEIGRFADVGYLHSYAGVIPSTYSSGGRTHHGKIIRDGNRWLRWAAVEAVWPGICADFDLRCFYDRLKKRKGANPAKVATARRLLIIIYRTLKEGRDYIPYKL